MMQFPINLSIIYSKDQGMTCPQTEKLNLNNEWTLACLFSGYTRQYLNPHSVEIRRISTTDNVIVHGSLYLRDANEPITSISGGIRRYNIGRIGGEMLHNFSKFMESGSSSVVVDFKDTTCGSLLLAYSLQGTVNITPVDALGNGEFRKRANMKHLEELSNDLGRLLGSETCCFSDVSLKCKGASIPAHKYVLSARSPVFAAMFRNPMKESLENEVVINDVDVSVLRMMLVFLYTGQLPDMTVSSASDLLLAADKYQIQDLKRGCCGLLCENISLQNVLGILLLGEIYCKDLKSCAMNYICNLCPNLSDLEETEEWEAMKKERPNLVMEILSSMVKAKEKKRMQPSRNSLF